jgi:UDP-GlcNAc:undecaprenyl-phosphate GlcNAc-1-phosphate transferase
VISLAAFFVLGLLEGNQMIALLALALAGSILGFLKYNFYPARIFMGDSGSLTVGFVVGFLAVMMTQSPGATITPMLPVLILGLPLLDAIWVMSHRIVKLQNPFIADRSHVHHRFLALGFKHSMTVVVIYTLSLFWAVSALLLRTFPDFLLFLYLGGSALVFYILLRHLHTNRDHYHFFQRDTQRSLRSGTLFQHVAAAVDQTMPLLGVMLLLYAVLATKCIWAGGIGYWSVTLLLFVVGVGVRIWIPVTSEFQLLLVYGVSCLAAFVVWSNGDATAFGLSHKRLGDALLLGTLLLAVLKLLFRRSGEFFLSTSDYLVMVVMVFLLLAAYQNEFIGFDFGGPLLRAIMLMFSIRTFAVKGNSARRLIVNTSLVLVGIFTLVGVFSSRM